MFGGTGGCTTSLGDWRASPPAAYRATRALASAATVWFSYRSCGVRSRPSLAAAIATLMATSESPPSSKKLAFRSTESDTETLRPDALQRRFHRRTAVGGRLGLAAAASRRRGRRPVRRGGTVRPPCGRVVFDPMPLPLKGIAGKRNQLRPVTSRAGVSSRHRYPLTRVARARAGRCRDRLGSGLGGA